MTKKGGAVANFIKREDIPESSPVMITLWRHPKELTKLIEDLNDL